MTDKTISRILAIHQMFYPVSGFILIAIWTIAHIAKGTMNIPGAILSISFLAITSYLSFKSYKEVKQEYKSEQPGKLNK